MKPVPQPIPWPSGVAERLNVSAESLQAARGKGDAPKLDYAGDVVRQKRALEWSVGVMYGLGEMLAATARMLQEIAKRLDEATGAEHSPFVDDDPRAQSDDDAEGA